MTGETSAASRAKARYPYLTGIRGLASAWVVMGHLCAFFASGATSGLRGFLTNWMLYAHIAVDIFIVLSGFCLYLSGSRTMELPVAAQRFYRSRALRILPPCYMTLSLSLAAYTAHRYLGHNRTPHDHYPLLPAVVGNLLLVQDVFAQINFINPPLWSVAAECKLYTLFPLFYRLLRARGPAIMLLAAAVVGYSLTLLAQSSISWLALGHFCPWYILLFAMGMCAAAVATDGTLPGRKYWLYAAPWILAASSALFAALIYRFPIGAGGEAAFLSHAAAIDAVAGIAFGAALVLLHLSPPAAAGNWATRRTRALFELAPVVALGEIAYSTYLLHMPILLGVRFVVVRAAGRSASAAIVATLICTIGLVSVLAGSLAFYLMVERRFVRSRTAPTAALPPANSPL
jgi:peptidoglycan/LPS O-acetylase OafA/YrhL